MLFVFEKEKIQSFWMRNTYIPLSIAFIDKNAKIVQIEKMQPLNDTIHYASRVPVLYALEVNQGWFEKHQITIGDTIHF